MELFDTPMPPPPPKSRRCMVPAVPSFSSPTENTTINSPTNIYGSPIYQPPIVTSQSTMDNSQPCTSANAIPFYENLMKSRFFK